MHSEDSSTIVEGPNRKFQIVNITDLIPLVSLSLVYLVFFNSFVGT